MFSWTKRYKEILIVSGLTLLFMGCASVPMAPQDIDVAAKRFEPPAGKANIYVTRTSKIFGDPHALNLLVDGEFRGAIASNTYFLFEVDPGTHRVEVSNYTSSKVITLHTEAGQNYFLGVGEQTTWSFTDRGFVYIQHLDDEEGREAVLGASLARWLRWSGRGIRSGAHRRRK